MISSVYTAGDLNVIRARITALIDMRAGSETIAEDSPVSGLQKATPRDIHVGQFDDRTGRELNATLKELKKTHRGYDDASDSPNKMDKWLVEMERLTQRKEELEVKWGDATTKSCVDDWLRIDKPPEFDSLLRMKDGKPDLELKKDTKTNGKSWQENYMLVTSRKITQKSIDSGRKRYNAARDAALNAISSLDIVIPGLRVMWKNDTAFGTYDDKCNTIDIGLGEITAYTKSVQAAHNLAVQIIKHEFAHAIWQRMDIETRMEWMEAVRSAGPISDYDRKHREDAKYGCHFRGTYRFGKVTDVHSDKKHGWLIAAAESHCIVLETIGADEDEYYNPHMNVDLGDDPGQIAKYRKNRRRLLGSYKRIFGHLGVAENFARIS